MGRLLPTDGVAHAIGVRRVRHHVEDLVVEPPDDDVVEDGTVGLVEQMRVLRPPGRDLRQVVGERPLQALEGVGPDHPDGAEVADVEDHRAAPAGEVFSDRAVRIGDGHLPSAERHHLGAELTMRRVERRAFEIVHADDCRAGVSC